MNLLQWSFHIRDIGIAGMNTLHFEDPISHLKKLKIELGAHEAWFLATCNRIEYLFILDKTSKVTHPTFTNLKPKIRIQLNSIVQHLLEVGCATDSLVFGENQILGQLKRSYTSCLESKLLGPKLSKLFNLVLKESKSIRAETGLNALNTSVAGVVAKLLAQELDSMDPILLVGAGETNQLLAQAAVKRGFKNISYTTRSNLKKLDAKLIPWQSYLDADLPQFTAVSFATPSKTILLNEVQMKKMKPKFVLDLSVPQNTDPKLVKKFKCKHIDIENIQDSLSFEKDQVRVMKKSVQNKIKTARQNILNQISILDINGVIEKNILLSKMIHDTLISQGLPTAFSNLTEEQKEALSKWSKLLLNKINHIHIESLKNYALTQNRDS